MGSKLKLESGYPTMEIGIGIRILLLSMKKDSYSRKEKLLRLLLPHACKLHNHYGDRILQTEFCRQCLIICAFHIYGACMDVMDDVAVAIAPFPFSVVIFLIVEK